MDQAFPQRIEEWNSSQLIGNEIKVIDQKIERSNQKQN